MECYLISQGHSLESVRSIPVDYMMDLTFLFRNGVIGWHTDARREYSAHAQMHNLQQILIAVNSKKHKVSKPPTFESLFPVHAEMSALGSESKIKPHRANRAIATLMAMARRKK